MKNFFLLALLVLPAIIFTIDGGHRMMAYADEDPLEEEADVEAEGDMEVTGTEEEEEDDSKARASPDADTDLLFIKPVVTGPTQMELPAGVPVEFLIGFRNKGKNDFILDTIEASFRYPMDFNFYIQNFSAIAYNREVAPSQEATLAYTFVPAEAFAGRPFGLNINLNYRDSNGGYFQEAVYNETVQIVELEEGLDGETFFLYVFLAAGVVLLLVIGQQTLLSVGRRERSTRKPTPVETGTNNPNNVDFEWLPKQTLANINKLQQSPKQSKSPKQGAKQTKSPKQSPRQRKATRTD